MRETDRHKTRHEKRGRRGAKTEEGKCQEFVDVEEERVEQEVEGGEYVVEGGEEDEEDEEEGERTSREPGSDARRGGWWMRRLKALTFGI